MPKVINKLNEPIRHWNSTSKSITITNNTNWSKLLPLAEFDYNNTPSATTSITPFFANKGYQLNLTIHPEHNLTSTHTCDFVTDLNELHQQLRQHIVKAQCEYQNSADSQQILAQEFN